MAIIDVLGWQPAGNVFAYRYPNPGLTNKSQLIVQEGQEAVLVKEGVYYGPILPGRHTLETKNFPFLTKLATLFSTNGVTPYTAEVWFVLKSIPINMKWGTSDPMLIEDPQYHLALPIRAFGSFGIRIVDTCRFLANLTGRIPVFTAKTISDYFKGVIITRAKTAVATVISESGCSLINVGTKLNEISLALERQLSGDFSEYGIELQLFMVNSISANESDPSVRQLRNALAKKAEMDILGYSYAQERSFDTLQAAASNEGSAGGMMGAGIGFGMGMGVGTPMGRAMNEVAKNLIVGHSKFCSNCGAGLSAGSRFCSNCGAKCS